MKLYRQFVLLALLVVVVFMPFDAMARGQAQNLPVSPLKVETAQGCFKFEVELAVSPSERNIGLMYRHQMADDHGMLFLNPEVQYNSFWMKNTYISLDIIFINADGTVANIVANTIPLNLEPVLSTEPVLGVLELTAGQAARMGLKVGDKITHEIFERKP